MPPGPVAETLRDAWRSRADGPAAGVRVEVLGERQRRPVAAVAVAAQRSGDDQLEVGGEAAVEVA